MKSEDVKAYGRLTLLFSFYHFVLKAKILANLFAFRQIYCINWFMLKRLLIPYIYQVVKKDKVDKLEKGARIISAGKFLSSFI